MNIESKKCFYILILALIITDLAILLEIKDIFRINDRSNQSHSKGVEG